MLACIVEPVVGVLQSYFCDGFITFLCGPIVLYNKLTIEMWQLHSVVTFKKQLKARLLKSSRDVFSRVAESEAKGPTLTPTPSIHKMLAPRIPTTPNPTPIPDSLK